MLFVWVSAASIAQKSLQRQPFNSGSGYGFIENKGQVKDQRGQSNRDVRFLISLPGMNVQLKANSFSYDTYLSESSVPQNNKGVFKCVYAPKDTGTKVNY